MTARFKIADPKKRVPWAGPAMSVRSSITARLMETWAHGQAIYDLLGEKRRDTDRIRNIVVLGINTFGWTFANRAMAVPPNRPYVRLLAPSAAVWEWGQPDQENLIEGSAVEFCQVVRRCETLPIRNCELSARPQQPGCQSRNVLPERRKSRRVQEPDSFRVELTDNDLSAMKVRVYDAGSLFCHPEPSRGINAGEPKPRAQPRGICLGGRARR